MTKSPYIAFLTVAFATAAPVVSETTVLISRRKRKCNQKEDMRPYIKKPPNAFMMFLREQRQTVVTERNPPLNSAEVNAVVGQRVRDTVREFALQICEYVFML